MSRNEWIRYFVDFDPGRSLKLSDFFSEFFSYAEHF